MKYQGKRFSVPASAGKLETCLRDGHTDPDKRGRCLRCGSKVAHDCTRSGHLWLEADGSRYTRHSERESATVPLHCAYCPAVTEGPTHARHTGRPISIPLAPAKTGP